MAVVYHNGFSSSSGLTLGSNTTVGGNNGMFGTLGASGSVHINFSGGNFVGEYAQFNAGAASTIFQIYYRPAAGATLGSGNTIFTLYTDNTYTNSTAPIRLDVTPSSGSVKFSFVDPSNSFATTTGTTTFALGTAIRLVLTQTSAGWKLNLNNTTTPEITYTHTQSLVGLQYGAIGTVFQNASGSYTGVADFDELWCGNLNTAPSTLAGKITDVYQGYLFNHLSADGQPYRGPVDGGNNSFSPAIDTVSEGAAYMDKYCVQNNDQTSFILCDNWILQNLLRSNSTLGNTQNNGAPANALNLMAFHYNSANTDGKGIGTIYDANWAGDADPERAQALLWAHARWGSSSFAVGTGSELTTPNYKQRALNVISDLRTYAFANSGTTGYNYLLADSFQQGNSVVNIGPDYNNPAAFRLFEQYDTGNALFWSNAVLGVYDVVTKGANTIFSGAPDSQGSTVLLNPDWLAMTVSSAVVSTTRSSYGDPNYGFNAFRIYPRLYDMYVWYGDPGALAALRLPKTFFTAKWVAGSINATYNHDGSNASGYEDNMFYYSAYWTIFSNDPGNPVATAIVTNKIANTLTYTQASYGSFFNTSPGGSGYAYFNQSWLLEDYMKTAGQWTNYGQVNESITGAGSITGISSITF